MLLRSYMLLHNHSTTLNGKELQPTHAPAILALIIFILYTLLLLLVARRLCNHESSSLVHAVASTVHVWWQYISCVTSYEVSPIDSPRSCVSRSICSIASIESRIEWRGSRNWVSRCPTLEIGPSVSFHGNAVISSHK